VVTKAKGADALRAKLAAKRAAAKEAKEGGGSGSSGSSSSASSSGTATPDAVTPFEELDDSR